MIAPRRCFAIVLLFAVLYPRPAHADPLVQYNFQGEPGNQLSTAPSFQAANINGLNVTRGAGLNPNAAMNSFNSNNWHDLAADDYVSFGFTVVGGYAVDLDKVQFNAQSSNTGPRNLGLFHSGDSFADAIEAFALNSGSTQFAIDIDLSTLVNLVGAVEFRIRALDDTSAAGGTVGSTGTFRINNFLNQADSPMTLFGEVYPLQNGSPAVVPEPSPAAIWFFVGAGAVGFLIGSRRRNLL